MTKDKNQIVRKGVTINASTVIRANARMIAKGRMLTKDHPLETRSSLSGEARIFNPPKLSINLDLSTAREIWQRVMAKHEHKAI